MVRSLRLVSAEFRNLLDGECWKFCLLCDETQEEKLQYCPLRRSDDDNDGASCHSTSARTFTLRAQVAAESGLAGAVRAINNLATGQVKKDTPSLKELTGREEAVFAGVVKEYEMMERAAEKTTELRQNS